MPQKTAPFHQHPLDVAVPKRFVGEPVTSRRIGNQLANHLRRAGTVLHRDAHFQIAGMIGPTVNLLTENAEPSAERCIFTGKARAGPNVGQIENEIVDRIAFVLEAGGDRETFAGVKE